MGGGGGGGGRKMAAAARRRTTTTTTTRTALGGRGHGCGRREQRASPSDCFPALLLLVALVSACLAQVSAVDVYTPAELSVENGTEGNLPCTFASSEVISSAASVTWSFQAEGSTTSVSFFYYSNGRAYPGQSTQFKDRSSWAGDLNKKDASINIANMQFQDNGTYICDVKNPPDIVVTPGEIKVRVVERGTVVPGNLTQFTPTLVAGISIGGVLGLSLLIILIVCVVYRKKNSKKHYSGCSTSESLVSPVKQAPRKSPSDTEGLVNSVPTRSHQGPVIYAQLDHSGGHYSDKIIKSESVVYADIRKN